MEQKSYVFKRDFTTKFGVVKENSELRVFRNFLYLDGGMIPPGYYKTFMRLLENDKLKNLYLKEINIIENKV